MNTKESPLLSVLLPNYNNGPYIVESLESVLNQSFTDFELVIVDDCSTDNGVAEIEKINDPRIKLIKKEQNSGIVDTLNIGLDAIETKYFIRMDGDDIASLDRFEKLVRFMEENQNVGVCSSAIQTFGIEEELWTFEKSPAKNRANLVFRHSVGHASSIFRTAVLKENNIRYSNDFWRMEDYHLFYSMRDKTDFSCIDDVCYFYRRGEHNVTQTIAERMEVGFARFYKMIFEDLGLDYTEDDVESHLGLGGRKYDLQMTLKDYERHVERLINANKKTKIFPENEFQIVVKEALKNIVFKLIDNKKIGFISLVPYFFKKQGFLKYYLLSKRTKTIA